MTVSVLPDPRVVPVRRFIEVSSNGAHAMTEWREMQRFAVLWGEEQVAEFESKAIAQAFADGWKAHRVRTRELVEQALGVSP